MILDDGRVLRLHQEDFCSASGRLPARKYEAHSGPGLTDLARIVEQNSHGQAAAGLAALGDFAAINYVAGDPTPLVGLVWALAVGIVTLWLDGPLEPRCVSLGTTPEILTAQIAALLESVLGARQGTADP
jgi:hypothetical protein